MKDRPTSRAAQPHLPAAAPQTSSSDRAPGIRDARVDVLQAAIDQSPRMRAQRSALEQRPSVQRRVRTGDRVPGEEARLIGDCLEEVGGTSTFSSVEGSKRTAVIGVSTDKLTTSSAMPKAGRDLSAFLMALGKSHSSADEVDVFIPIEREDLVSGMAQAATTATREFDFDDFLAADTDTKEEPSSASNAAIGPSSESSSSATDVPVSKPTSKPGHLSPATILLHELGHAAQYFRYFDERDSSGASSASASSSRPSLVEMHAPSLLQTGILQKALKEHDLRSSIWTRMVVELETLGDIFHGLEDVWGKSPRSDIQATPTRHLEQLDAADRLRLKILECAKLWLEHDVMQNVEHPFAGDRKEGIRLRHGEEPDLSEMKFRTNSSGRNEAYYTPLGNTPNFKEISPERGQAAEYMNPELRKFSASLLENIQSLRNTLTSLTTENPQIFEDI